MGGGLGEGGGGGGGGCVSSFKTKRLEDKSLNSLTLPTHVNGTL